MWTTYPRLLQLTVRGLALEPSQLFFSSMGAKRTQALLMRTGIKAGSEPIQEKQRKHIVPLATKNDMRRVPKASPKLKKKKLAG
jgi:hypothetical protein